MILYNIYSKYDSNLISKTRKTKQEVVEILPLTVSEEYGTLSLSYQDKPESIYCHVSLIGHHSDRTSIVLSSASLIDADPDLCQAKMNAILSI